MNTAANISGRALVLGLVLIGGALVPAYAATPSNDTVAGATVISTLPTTVVQDTSEANAEPLDTELLATGCGSPNLVVGSVWFKYTDVTGEGFGYDPVPDYNADVVLTQGDPAEGNVVSCGVGPVHGPPGTTYYLGVLANAIPAGAGNLQVTFYGLPQATMVVDSKAVVRGGGVLLVTGRYRCTPGAVSSAITVEVFQGRTHGFLFQDFAGPEPCTGEFQEWAGLLGPDEVYRPGRPPRFHTGEARVIATVDAFSTTYEGVGTEARTEQTVWVEPEGRS